MPTPSVQQILQWLRNVARKPRIILLGPRDGVAESALRNLGLPPTLVTPSVQRFRDEALAQVRRALPVDATAVGLTVGLYSDDRSFLASMLSGMRGRLVVRDFTTVPSAESIVEWIGAVIAFCEAAPSTREATKKDARNHDPHHQVPAEANRLVRALCALPTVGQLRFWKASGSEFSVSVVGEYIKISLTNRYGLVIEPVCGHPAHLEALRIVVEKLLSESR